MVEAGYTGVAISPRMIYVDASRLVLADGFIGETFTAMVEGRKDQASNLILIDEATWNRGIADLSRTIRVDVTLSRKKTGFLPPGHLLAESGSLADIRNSTIC